MRPAHALRVRALGLTGIAVALVALFLLPSGLALPASAAPLPRSALASPTSSSGPESLAPAAPSAPTVLASKPTCPELLGPSWQDTCITTTDPTSQRNDGLNWSLRTNLQYVSGQIDLSSGQNVTMLGGEWITENYTAWVGFDAYKSGSNPTLLYPMADLNGTIIIDNSVNLPNPVQGANIVFRMARVGGDWWTFSADSYLITNNGGNGTYNLSTPRADPGRGSTNYPELETLETGGSLPISNTAFYVAATPALEVNTTGFGAGAHVPLNGIYVASAVPSDSVPVVGTDQVNGGAPVGLGNGYVAINPPSIASTFTTPTTTNGTTLWGAAVSGAGATHLWLGAETVDPLYSNITGAELVSVIPSAMPKEGQTIVHELVVPINGTEDLALALVDANLTFTFNGTTYNIQGTYPVVGVYTAQGAVGIWANSVQTAGALVEFGILSEGGGVWQVTLDGQNLTGGWQEASASFAGNITLNTTTLWGETDSPFAAAPNANIGELGIGEVPVLQSNQPILAFFGNYTPYWVNSSVLLRSTSGWGTPYEGYAWTWCPGCVKHPEDDVLLGSDQITAVLPGTVLIGNATLFKNSVPLTNDTPLWTASLVQIVLSPGTIASGATVSSGGRASLAIDVTFNNQAVSGASVLACYDTLGDGTCGTFSPGTTAGNYTDTFTAFPDLTGTVVDTIDIVLNTANGEAEGTKLVNITVPTTIAALFAGYGDSDPTIQPGASLTVIAWTNQSGAPITSASPAASVGINSTSFPTCAFSATGTGVYACSFIVPNFKSGLGAVSVGSSGVGLNVPTATLDFKVNPFVLALGAVSATFATGTASGVAGGTNITLSVTASGPSGAVAGATVQFSFNQAFPGRGTLLYATTSSNGQASISLNAPTDLSQNYQYNVGAEAWAGGYTHANATGNAIFTVDAPVSSTPSSSGSGSLLLYAGVGGVLVVVVAVAAVVMMRRRKGEKSDSPPEAWSPGPGAPGAPGAEPPAGEGPSGPGGQ